MNQNELAFWNASTTGVLLIGGQGKRMGNMNKSTLKIGDATFGEVALNALSIFPKTIISAKTRTASLPVAYDKVYDIVDAGPLGAIFSVLQKVNTEYIFVISCDMPYIDRSIISYVLSQGDQRYAAIIPTIWNRLEPLCGLYSRKMLPIIEAQLEAKTFSLRKTLEMVPTKYVDLTGTPHARKLFNVNYPTDYAKVATEQ